MENTPGLGFRPHDDELVGYFLRHKILGDTHLVKDFISEVNIYNYDPWNLRLQSKVKSRDLVWYFFSKREKKNASRNQQSRRTPSGFWKLTGDSVDVKDVREFWCGVRGKIGYKRVLVFQRGRNSSSKGTKSDWVMHELHYSLLPEDQETYVICRLEYKGEDMDILSYNPTVLPPAFVASMTQSAGSVVDQSLQGYSDSHNTYPEYDSPNQGQQFGGNYNMDQLLQGNSGSFHNYGSANQGPQLGGNFNMDQSVQENLGVFHSSFEYGSEYQGHWFTQDLNTQQQAPLGMYEEEPQMIWNDDIHRDFEFLGDQMTYMQENRSNHRPPNPVTGVLADYSSDSDIDSMLGRDTSSSTGSVGSSNGSWHTPRDDVLSLSTIEPKHNHEAKEQPKQLKSQLQGKEKVINAQRSECEWKMAEDLVKKAPSTNKIKHCWIVLEEMSQRNSQWTYLRNLIIGFLLFISIIGWIIMIG